MLRALMIVFAACGTSAPPAQVGSATPPIVPDASPPQETKPVTPPASVLASATDSFEYKVGNPHFHGRTIVRVTGDGTAEVSLERGGKIERYAGPAPAAKLAALRESLTKHPLASYQPKQRPPVPDEVTMEFTLVTDGERSAASILHNERYEMDALGELVELVQDIAKAVSSGKIAY